MARAGVDERRDHRVRRGARARGRRAARPPRRRAPRGARGGSRRAVGDLVGAADEAVERVDRGPLGARQAARRRVVGRVVAALHAPAAPVGARDLLVPPVHVPSTVVGGPLDQQPSAIDRGLIVVTGKGGVGKTTVAAALALVAARAGRRTIALEVAGQRRDARAARPPGRGPARRRGGAGAGSVGLDRRPRARARRVGGPDRPPARARRAGAALARVRGVRGGGARRTGARDDHQGLGARLAAALDARRRALRDGRRSTRRRPATGSRCSARRAPTPRSHASGRSRRRRERSPPRSTTAAPARSSRSRRSRRRR